LEGKGGHLELHDAAALLARAFDRDPFICWAEPDAERRPVTLTAIFTGVLSLSVRYGGTLLEPGVGAVEWRDAAKIHVGPLAALRSGLWRVALVAPASVLRRFSAHDSEAMARVRPFLLPGVAYLGSLGVEPSQMGRGHGGRLLERALERIATRWSRCVLRTEQPRNVAFYERHGFALADESVAAVSGLRVWVFSRRL
jgi:ribosomal protein S18 acetylase RimI-like enzyme